MSFVLITGATGFIGRALVRRLSGEGMTLRLLVRRPDQAAGLTPPNTTLIQGSLEDAETLRRAVSGCGAVYHLAALARGWAEDPSEFDRANVAGTRNLLAAAAEAGVRRVVHTSTVMAIGPTDEVVADETFVTPFPALSDYQRTKREAERVVDEFVKKGLEVVTVSPSLVFGPSSSTRRTSFNRFLQDFIRGRPVVIPGDGTQRLNLVYLEDVVEGHLLAMAKGRSGERYILGGENVGMVELADRVNRLMGTTRRLHHIPFSMAKAVGAIEEVRSGLFGVEPLITRRGVEVYRHSWTYSSEKARRELGYHPTPLTDSLQMTIRWLQGNKN
jgi:farnesol dehydrogenase